MYCRPYMRPGHPFPPGSCCVSATPAITRRPRRDVWPCHRDEACTGRQCGILALHGPARQRCEDDSGPVCSGVGLAFRKVGAVPAAGRRRVRPTTALEAHISCADSNGAPRYVSTLFLLKIHTGVKFTGKQSRRHSSDPGPTFSQGLSSLKFGVTITPTDN